MSWDSELRQDITEEFARLCGVFRWSDSFSVHHPMTEKQAREAHLRARDRQAFQPGKCQRCGAQSPVRREGRGRQALYCGKKCQWKAHRVASKARRPPNLCRCGREISGARQRRWCNRACKRKHLKQGGVH